MLADLETILRNRPDEVREQHEEDIGPAAAAWWTEAGVGDDWTVTGDPH